MRITAYRTRPLMPPRDDLKAALRDSRLRLKDGDIFAVSSKIVSIDEGRAVACEGTDRSALIVREADWYLNAPASSRWRRRFTIARGALVGSAGIDESNGMGHYVLYPTDPFASARRLRRWLMKEYGVAELGLIITDSMSLPFRRGAIGFALSWDGIDPLEDYRGTPDIFGRTIEIEMANRIDALAAAAVLEMGEGGEQMPIAVIRGVKGAKLKNRPKKADQLIIEPADDLFAPLLWKKGWKRGGQGR